MLTLRGAWGRPGCAPPWRAPEQHPMHPAPLPAALHRSLQHCLWSARRVIQGQDAADVLPLWNTVRAEDQAFACTAGLVQSALHCRGGQFGDRKRTRPSRVPSSALSRSWRCLAASNSSALPGLPFLASLRSLPPAAVHPRVRSPLSHTSLWQDVTRNTYPSEALHPDVSTVLFAEDPVQLPMPDHSAHTFVRSEAYPFQSLCGQSSALCWHLQPSPCSLTSPLVLRYFVDLLQQLQPSSSPCMQCKIIRKLLHHPVLEAWLVQDAQALDTYEFRLTACLPSEGRSQDYCAPFAYVVRLGSP